MNRTLQVAALVSATTSFSLCAAAQVSSQVPAAEVPAAQGPDLAALLRDRSVTLVRASKLFVPGKDGADPTYIDGQKHWLIYKDKQIQGIVREPDTPVEIAQSELAARLVDYSKSHPQSVAVPGFVDADSRWFRNPRDLGDRGADPTASAADALETWQEGPEELLTQAGISVLFVPAALEAQASGKGALVSLASQQPSLLSEGAMQWRLSSLNTRGSNLTRGDVVKGLASAFDAARKYAEAKEKYEKDLADFEKKRKDFLAYYKKNPLKKGEKVEESKSAPAPRQQRGRLPQTKEELEQMLRSVPPAMRDQIRARLEAQMKEAAEAAKKAAGEAAPDKKDDAKTDTKKAPPKPARPKAPPVEAAKEAMLRVLAGKEALRVEVHRADEIRALVEVLAKEGVERVTILGGTEAHMVTKELRSIDATVVLRPETLPATGFDALPEHMAASAKRLSDEGIRVAFGSAGTTSGRALPFLAARAVAFGMNEGLALQALTGNGIEASGAEGIVDPGIVIWSDDPLATTSTPVAIVRGRLERKLATPSRGENGAASDKNTSQKNTSETNK